MELTAVEFITIVPGIVAVVVAWRRSAATAFLNVYLPVLLLLPEYYRWILDGLPDPSFSQAAILPIGVVYFIRPPRRWAWTATDFLVGAFVLAIVYSEYLNLGYADAQNKAFDMLTWVVLPYVLAKGLIEPDLRVRFARRFVWLLFLVSVVSVYEFRMSATPFRLLLDPFFPDQGYEWVTTFRWGFTRIAGPYGHAILAGIVLGVAYRLQRWLEWQGQWEPVFQRLPWLPVSKARAITVGVLSGVLMTMVRGPWLACVVAAVVAAIGRARARWHFLMLVATLMVMLGIPAVTSLSSYASVGRRHAASDSQETVAYRWELVQKYVAIAWEKGAWGWGSNEWPKLPGMPSIDNHYLFLWLTHGHTALVLLVAIFLVQGWRLFRLGMALPEQHGPPLSFTLLAAFVVIGVSLATVYMGLQVFPVLFLLTGWADSHVARTPRPWNDWLGPLRFQRVIA